MMANFLSLHFTARSLHQLGEQMFDQLGVRLETIFFATEFNLKFFSATDNHKILVKIKSINVTSVPDPRRNAV